MSCMGRPSAPAWPGRAPATCPGGISKTLLVITHVNLSSRLHLSIPLTPVSNTNTPLTRLQTSYPPKMDPFSAEGELVNIHTAFVQGQYASVLSDFSPADFSPSNALPIQILQYRAQLALGQNSAVLSAISSADAKKTIDLAAVRALAANDTAAATTLAETAGDNLSVQLLCGTVLANAGQPEAALALLSQHQGSLDAVALIIQIHLSQNRTDLALQAAKSARSFAQDALLVNLAEAWIGVREGGENYQKAFYVFEELAQGPSTRSVRSLVQQGVAELHMGRVEEAEVVLGEALALEEGNEEAVANKVVLERVLGRDGGEWVGRLGEGHEMIVDARAKREAFAQAMGKYSPKFAEV